MQLKISGLILDLIDDSLCEIGPVVISCEKSQTQLCNDVMAVDNIPR